MVAAGAVAVSDDGHPVMSSHLMRTALEYAPPFGIPVADHCEDAPLARGGAMHDGIVATRMGLKGIPSAAEEIHVARDCILAELTGGHVHLCHMSTRGSVSLIRRAKELGLNVTAEAAPHHFSLTHERCEGYDTNAKMNPPLREAEDRDAIRRALADGTIDCIATDHAPHHYDAKEREFDDAPNGIIASRRHCHWHFVSWCIPGAFARKDDRSDELRAGKLWHLPAARCVRRCRRSRDVRPRCRLDGRPARFRSKSHNTPWGGESMPAA